MDALAQTLLAAVVVAGTGLAALAAATGIPHLVERRRGR
jgi:hypothetical protein